MTHPLQTLHGKVEAGEVLQAYEASNIWPTYYDKEAGRNVLIWLDACKASQGSLDAAKALHDAVLPGWMWTHVSEAKFNGERFDTTGISIVRVHLPNVKGKTAKADDPARAWLLAVLRALINEGE